MESFKLLNIEPDNEEINNFLIMVEDNVKDIKTLSPEHIAEKTQNLLLEKCKNFLNTYLPISEEIIKVIFFLYQSKKKGFKNVHRY